MTIRVNVHLESNGFGKNQLNDNLMILEEKCTLDQLVGSLGIPPSEIGLYLINDHLGKKHDFLNEGDEVHIFPPIEGG